MNKIVLKRVDGTVIGEYEASSTKEAVEMAVKNGTSLSGAYLSGAYLSGADLSRADLSGADLRKADLRKADLYGADLRKADLYGADLYGADLYGADLSGADLYGAYLRKADLSGANLSKADLREADLYGADLSPIKADVLDVLGRNVAEVPGLLAALKEGRVGGTAYEGECACLVGTLANLRKCNYEELSPNSSRPAERWFMGIRKGDTPENNQISKVTVGWVEEWLGNQG